MKELYVRCNGGHYFRADFHRPIPGCPWDGWSCEGLDIALASFERLRAERNDPSIADLKQSGVPESALKRLLIIEFGDRAAAFQALAPERYLHQGRELLAHEVGEDLI